MTLKENYKLFVCDSMRSTIRNINDQKMKRLGMQIKIEMLIRIEENLRRNHCGITANHERKENLAQDLVKKK